MRRTSGLNRALPADKTRCHKTVRTHRALSGRNSLELLNCFQVLFCSWVPTIHWWCDQVFSRDNGLFVDFSLPFLGSVLQSAFQKFVCFLFSLYSLFSLFAVFFSVSLLYGTIYFFVV